MKRIMAVLLAAIMLCAGLATAETDVTGKWYLNLIRVGEQEVSPAIIGMSMSFDIAADGTMKAFNTQGEETSEASGTWRLNEEGNLAMKLDETEDIVTVGENQLEINLGEQTMIFTREEPAAAAAPVAIPAESEDAFFGTWKLAELDMDGSLIPVSLAASMGIEINAVLTVEAGKASFSVTVLGVETPAMEGTTAFADGKLQLTLEGAEKPIEVSLCDNGELFAELAAQPLGAIPMYFTSAK